MLARIVLQVRHHVVDEQVALPLGVCERRGQQKADDALVLLQDVDAHVGGDVAEQDLQVELGVAPLFVQCGRGGEERLPFAPFVAPSAEPDPLAQRLARLQGHRRAAERRPFLGKSREPLRVRLFGLARRLLLRGLTRSLLLRGLARRLLSSKERSILLIMAPTKLRLRECTFSVVVTE